MALSDVPGKPVSPVEESRPGSASASITPILGLRSIEGLPSTELNAGRPSDCAGRNDNGCLNIA